MGTDLTEQQAFLVLNALPKLSVTIITTNPTVGYVTFQSDRGHARRGDFGADWLESSGPDRAMKLLWSSVRGRLSLACLRSSSSMDTALTEPQAFLILNALPNIGPVATNRLLEELGGDPRAIFTAGVRQLESVKGVGPENAQTLVRWAEQFDLAREEKKLVDAKATFITTRDGT